MSEKINSDLSKSCTATIEKLNLPKVKVVDVKEVLNKQKFED